MWLVRWGPVAIVNNAEQCHVVNYTSSYPAGNVARNAFVESKLGKYTEGCSKTALEILALFFLVVKLWWLWELRKVHAARWLCGAIGVTVGVAVTVGSRHGFI